MPVWGHALTFSPDAIGAAIKDTGKDVVLVSGGCHSGLLAGAAQCGFFAAHPDVIATGCQRSFEAVGASDDYLKYFFLSDTEASDANRDGRISFREAHSFAAAHVERHSIVYSDIDHAVDTYFAEHPDDLPPTVTLETLRPLVAGLPLTQRAAFRVLSDGLKEGQIISLTDQVARNRQALERLGDDIEMSSAARNAEMALAYPLSLVGLARQAIYIDRGNALATDTLACQERSIAEYF